MSDNNLAIIGGGSVGPLLLACIADEAKKEGLSLSGLTFHLIDKNGFGNGGIAYGECHKSHLLNSVIDEMSPNDQGGFGRFLDSVGIKVNNEDFYPRHMYKSYIQEELRDKSISILKSLGARIEQHDADVLVHKNIDSTYAILDKKSNIVSKSLLRLSPDQFVMTVGYGPNENFSTLRNFDGFFDSIYGGLESSFSDKFEILNRPNLRIAIIGSGPALYDFINQIEPNGHKLFVFSNAGKGLGVRDTSIESEETSMPPQGLLSLGYDSTYEEAIECLTQEFASASQGRSQRRIALDVSKNLRSILTRLGTDVAYAFMNSSEFSPVKHYATPIPMESHQRLKSFNPAFVKACIKEKDIIPQKDGSFTINAGYEAYIADFVINATGHGRHNSPILEGLKRQNLAQFNPITGALDTDRSGYKLSVSGLNVIGPATHVGIDGIESFYVYTKHFAENFVSVLKREVGLATVFDRRLQM